MTTSSEWTTLPQDANWVSPSESKGHEEEARRHTLSCRVRSIRNQQLLVLDLNI